MTLPVVDRPDLLGPAPHVVYSVYQSNSGFRNALFGGLCSTPLSTTMPGPLANLLRRQGRQQRRMFVSYPINDCSLVGLFTPVAYHGGTVSGGRRNATTASALLKSENTHHSNWPSWSQWQSWHYNFRRILLSVWNPATLKLTSWLVHASATGWDRNQQRCDPFHKSLKDPVSEHSREPVAQEKTAKDAKKRKRSLRRHTYTKRKGGKRKVRIAIVGGGIAGVSVAHALVEKYKHLQQSTGSSPYDCEIILFDGGLPPSMLQNPEKEDTRSRAHDVEHELSSRLTAFNTKNANMANNRRRRNHNHRDINPQWEAATARNGNSMVPAASFHIFSQPAVLRSILRDVVNDWWYRPPINRPVSLRRHNSQDSVSIAPSNGSRKSHALETPPPYFAVHLWSCLALGGDSDTASGERISFVRFVFRYLQTTLAWRGTEAAHERGKALCQLAQANRNIFKRQMESEDPEFAKSLGHSKGFLALYRTKEEAESEVKEIHSVGEHAHLVPWEEARQMEPRLDGKIPFEVHAVQRPHDITANCANFVSHRLKRLQDSGEVVVKNIHVDKINKRFDWRNKATSLLYSVVGKDGSIHSDFDILVLAAGVETPLLASKFGIGAHCPTYPLRGFSLNIALPPLGGRLMAHPNGTRLNQPFRVDGLYISSVTDNSARIVGFGEFAGYRSKPEQVPSRAPLVLASYAKNFFPDAAPNVGNAIACFRALSPDDLPLVGEVPGRPGVFLHTGHGSLGWTTGLATGELLAQKIQDKLAGEEKDPIVCLSDGTIIDSRKFDPGRF